MNKKLTKKIIHILQISQKKNAVNGQNRCFCFNFKPV